LNGSKTVSNELLFIQALALSLLESNEIEQTMELTICEANCESEETPSKEKLRE